MSEIPRSIREEMIRQVSIWGDQKHSHFVWLGILMEEVGEVSKAMLEVDTKDFKEELIQVCAVALTWYNSL